MITLNKQKTLTKRQFNRLGKMSINDRRRACLLGYDRVRREAKLRSIAKASVVLAIVLTYIIPMKDEQRTATIKKIANQIATIILYIISIVGVSLANNINPKT
ncbi:MAG: hypothetical protein HAW67_08390 [Endozoicomonadaceae bacterium]|nr:hypothetical protein [Endozoicomonadaceae bacterium]